MSKKNKIFKIVLLAFFISSFFYFFYYDYILIQTNKLFQLNIKKFLKNEIETDIKPSWSNGWCVIDNKFYFLKQAYYFYDLTTIVVLFLANSNLNSTADSFSFRLQNGTRLEKVEMKKNMLLVKLLQDPIQKNDSLFNIYIDHKSRHESCGLDVKYLKWNIPFESKPGDFAYCSKFFHYANRESVLNFKYQLNILKQIGYQKVIFYDFNYHPNASEVRSSLEELFISQKDYLEVNHFDYLANTEFNGAGEFIPFLKNFDRDFDHDLSRNSNRFNLKHLTLFLNKCYFDNYDKFKYISASEPDDLVFSRTQSVYNMNELLSQNKLHEIENIQCKNPENFLKEGLKRFKSHIPNTKSYGFPQHIFILNDAIEYFCEEFKNISLKSQTSFVANKYVYRTKNLFDSKINGNCINLLLSDEKDIQSMQFICDFYQKNIHSNSEKIKTKEKNQIILYDRFIFGIESSSQKTIHNTSITFGLDQHRFTFFVTESKTIRYSKSTEKYSSEEYGAWAHFRRHLSNDFNIQAKHLFIDFYYYKCFFLKSFN